LEEVIIKKRVEGGFVQDLVQALLVPGQSPGQSQDHVQDQGLAQLQTILGEVVALLGIERQGSVGVLVLHLLWDLVMVSFFTISYN
jgi:hypothetical protein